MYLLLKSYVGYRISHPKLQIYNFQGTYWKSFRTLKLKKNYFLKMCPIFDGFVYNFDRSNGDII